ncbi:hypothetical protein HDU93_002278, partial [Gonapodya sp. JEL0774]
MAEPFQIEHDIPMDDYHPGAQLRVPRVLPLVYRGQDEPQPKSIHVVPIDPYEDHPLTEVQDVDRRFFTLKLTDRNWENWAFDTISKGSSVTLCNWWSDGRDLEKYTGWVQLTMHNIRLNVPPVNKDGIPVKKLLQSILYLRFRILVALNNHPFAFIQGRQVIYLPDLFNAIAACGIEQVRIQEWGSKQSADISWLPEFRDERYWVDGILDLGVLVEGSTPTMLTLFKAGPALHPAFRRYWSPLHGAVGQGYGGGEFDFLLNGKKVTCDAYNGDQMHAIKSFSWGGSHNPFNQGKTRLAKHNAVTAHLALQEKMDDQYEDHMLGTSRLEFTFKKSDGWRSPRDCLEALAGLDIRRDLFGNNFIFTIEVSVESIRRQTQQLVLAAYTTWKMGTTGPLRPRPGELPSDLERTIVADICNSVGHNGGRGFVYKKSDLGHTITRRADGVYWYEEAAQQLAAQLQRDRVELIRGYAIGEDLRHCVLHQG